MDELHTLDDILGRLDATPAEAALDRLIDAAEYGSFQEVLEALLAYTAAVETEDDLGSV